MKTPCLLLFLSWSFAALAEDPATQTTDAPPPSAPPKLSAAELTKLAEPIALHPDPLISIILPGAAYPLEIVQAARFVRDTNNIPKLDEQPWDENVKSVAKFPELIRMMDSNLTWTVDLGQAFVDQPKELMDAIQALRAKAQQAGTLQSSPQQIVTVTNVVMVQTNFTQIVTVTNEIVQIYPSNPEVVYVPAYPPTVYYPPPAYVYDPYAPLVTFGVAVGVAAILANNCDWHSGGVYVGHHGAVVWGGGDYHGGNVTVNNNFSQNINNNFNQNVNRGNNNAGQRPGGGSSGPKPSQLPAQTKWQPDQNRVRSSGMGGASASTREARGWGSGGAQPATGNIGARPSTGNVGTRRSTGNVGAQPLAGNLNSRPPKGGSANARPAASPSAGRSSPSVSRSSSPGSAFGGTSNGSSARSQSARGFSSRSSGGFGGGRGGGGFGGGRRR